MRQQDRADAVGMLDEAMEAPPIVRFDERRMHIRAYNYWASLLGERKLPSIEDLNPSELHDFGSHSVLLDFTGGVENPAVAFLGSALADQCGISTPIRHASEIPPRTLLSRLTDHYLQIVANAAPIGFEAEFTNQRGDEIMYRGIMMPFSTDDDRIDFVYGVINWREVATDALSDSIAAEVKAAPRPGLTLVPDAPVWADAPMAFELDDAGAYELTSDMRIQADDGPALFDHADDTLADRLARARDAAAAAAASEGRTRHALYRAIGLAHAFARAAVARPDDYAELLAESGLIAQPRSPRTALVKLVFGESYDKTRLAEFVCAIDYALDHDMAPGALIDHLHEVQGGLKGLVAIVRAARRGAIADKPASATSRARSKLGTARPLGDEAVAFDEAGLAIVVLRQEADGSHAVIATLDGQARLIGQVYSAAARQL
ncbi:MAG TPA: hypothetical protein VNS79_09160 [Sphingobium sp.]|nr:hypothetical protein [Sphingobium sp.]